jgi:hypothetical protein
LFGHSTGRVLETEGEEEEAQMDEGEVEKKK